LVRRVDDTLLFGTTATSATGGELLGSLKVLVLSANRHDPQASTIYDCEIHAAAYFAWALQQLRDRLSADGYFDIVLNVAAPMDVVEIPGLKARYLRIVNAAWKLVFEEGTTAFNQGVSSGVAVELLRQRMVQPVPGAKHRRFEVLPESIAPVVSLSLDPYMEPRMYAVVDMGAGTTEMSVFHAGESGADQKVLCYKDKTFLTGGNDLGAAGGNSEAEAAIIAAVEREYRKIWDDAFKLDSSNPLSKRRWKDLTLVLSGGGTRHINLARRLQRTNPLPTWQEHPTNYAVTRHTPGTLTLRSGMTVDDGSMFAVANGLALERIRWPIVFPPRQIEPLVPPQSDAPLGGVPDDAARPRWL